MKPLIIALALITAPLLAQAQIGVSVNIDQPGFFGQINIGNLPRPEVIYSAPVIVEAPPANVNYEPVYLRVPPEHHRNWGRYCHEYHACNRQVYFVTDDWYQNTYAPHYAHEHEHEHEREYHEHEHDREHEHDEEHDHGRGHDREHGHEDER